jgi:DNA polymerase alpha subunit A
LYKHLQIGIDGVFITLLLLRKKKYAAIKVSNLEDVLTNKAVIIPERETKGIDIVRREYCEFSKMIMNIALDILLDMKDRENIFSNLLDLLKEIE